MKTIKILAVVLAGVASAATADPAPRAIVHIGDLNLGSSQGQQTLERRLNGAVRSMCQATNVHSLADQAQYRRCETAARASIQRHVGVAMNDETRFAYR